MEEFDDREPIARAVKGDVEAFETLVTHYRQRAYQYALSFMKNHHDALDLSQEAFVKAFKALKSFEVGRPFLPWFLRILRNLCLNRIQKKKREPDTPGFMEGTEIIQILPGRSPKAPEEMQKKELRKAIEKALETLPDDHREVIVLRHFEDLTYEEIAKVMEVPIGTVMSRLFNARKKMAAAMEKIKKITEA